VRLPSWLRLCLQILFRSSQTAYLPEAAYEALRQVAFDERRIHDLLMEGVELALKKRGYPAIADMKARSLRKER
jgi:hypothetical protein